MDIRRARTVVLYATTRGWMMWNWLTALETGRPSSSMTCCAVAAHSSGGAWDLRSPKASPFGTSARYLALAEKVKPAPARTHDLAALRAVLSTGSLLAPQSFDYVYRAIGPTLQLSSISGGTDDRTK